MRASIFPSTNVAITSTIIRNRVPASARRRNYIRSSIAISAVIGLTNDSPLLQFSNSQRVSQVGLSYRNVLLASANRINSVSVLQFRRTKRVTGRVAICPCFNAVVSAICLGPSSFIFVIFQCIGFHTRPVNMRLTSYFNGV